MKKESVLMRKKFLLILLNLCLLLLLLCGCGFSASIGKVPEKTEKNSAIQRLYIKGGKITGEDGKTVQLTGMSSHGLLWYPQYANAGAMQTLKEYGANTFRIAAYSDDEGGGYVQRKEETMKFVYMAIENAISEDLYAIVDWHVLNDGNPLTNMDKAKEFFDEISGHYGDIPNLLYEICNEPNSGAGWDDIYNYANQVIPVIRNHAPGAIIIVGTPDYSSSVERVFDHPLEFDNVMYSFHFYAGQHDEYYNDLFNKCEKENLPLFVSEWGINYAVNGKPAISQAEKFVTVLNRRNISWIGWSLCNKNEVFSAIKPDCWKFSGWEKDDLTEVGKVFFENFQ